MNNDMKPRKITYFYAFLISLVFAVILFVFANKFNVKSSIVPFFFVSVFDIANVLLVKSMIPRLCFVPFMISSITLFVLYKIVSVSSVIKMYFSDGFLSDGEYSHAYVLDLLMISLIISTFVFNVFLRFLMSRQKLKSVSKTSVKRFVICIGILLIVSSISIASWNFAVPYKDAYLKHVSTFSVEKWQQFPDSRINMIDSLCSEYKIEGMSRSEIENLLGKADFSDNLSDIYIIGDNENGHNKLVVDYVNDVVSSFEIETKMFMSDVVESVQNQQ